MRIAKAYVAPLLLFVFVAANFAGAQATSKLKDPNRMEVTAREPRTAADTVEPRSSQTAPAQAGPTQTMPVQTAPSQENPAKPAPTQPAAAQTTHRFWDRENILLFSGVGAARFLDFASTLNLRHRGLDEIFLTNGIVDNHALFAGIEAGGTVASIGVSYLFHRTGHHQLERWTSIVHFGLTAGGAARNYALKTPHNQ